MTRRRAFGSIDSLGKDVDGVVKWRIRWREDGKRRTEVVHGTYNEASHRLSVIHARVGSRRQNLTTVERIYEGYYLPDAARTKSQTTRARLKSSWDKYVGPRWGSEPVASVRAGAVEEWLQGVPYGMAAGSLAILRWICRKAVMLDIITSSPLEMPISMPPNENRRSRDVISSESIDTYYDAVKGSEVEAAWILAVFGGCRSGESLGVMVGEVEYREMDGTKFAGVHVQRQSQQYGGVAIDDRTGLPRLKTVKSNRWIVILDPWASRLMELQEQAKARGDAFLVDDGFGQPVGTHRLSLRLKELYRSAGLPQIPARNLRASYATMAHHDMGLPTEDVARIMGHSRPVITWGTYERPELEQIAATVIRGR